MRTCPSCNEKENSDDERFCISCGLDLDKSESSTTSKDLETSNKEIVKPADEATVNEKENHVLNGKLVFSDGSYFLIDDSQRLVGRSDLKKHTSVDPDLISRSHFTIYEKNQKYFIKDGRTNVQNTPSENGTFVNDEKMTRDEFELKNGDKILVSDIEMKFEV